MKILLSHAKESSRDFQLEAPVRLEELEGRGEAGRVRAEIHVTPIGERWSVTGKVEARFPFLCDLCGDPFRDVIEGEFNLMVMTRGMRGVNAEEQDGMEDADEDLLFLQTGSQEIDLTQKVQEILLLNLPIQLRCHDECAGLCPNCGANRNRGPCRCEEQAVDPRWSALQDLKKMMDSGGETSEKREE